MTIKRKLHIATRRSPLALWQANTVKSLLEARGFIVELKLVTTSGDKMQRGALAEVSLDDPKIPAHLRSGKGLFVKEVQEEILAGQADLAVHSMKDLPNESTDGLRVAAVLPRANPADVIIFSPSLMEETNKALNLSAQPDECMHDVLNVLCASEWSTARPIGTTSARRQHFLRRLLSPKSLPLVVLRGNVDTRLRRVANDEFSFIMLARAGIDRLALHHPSSMLTLPVDVSVPAPAQGVVAIECRNSDDELRSHLASLNHTETSLQAAVERTALWLTGGDCHTALAAHFTAAQLHTWAACGDAFSQLHFRPEDTHLVQLNERAQTHDYHDLFLWLKQSTLARELYRRLIDAKFDAVMTLRTPQTSGDASC